MYEQVKILTDQNQHLAALVEQKETDNRRYRNETASLDDQLVKLVGFWESLHYIN